MTVKLETSEFGEGSPVLVLHGLFGSGRNWTSIAQKLAAQHRIFTVDLRNHGISPWADSMAYAAMAEDVRALIRARGLPRVALLGHSMGGKVAMLMALTYGKAVERLVVVDIAPVSYPPTPSAYLRAMQAIDLERVARRGDVEAGLAEAVPDPAERAFLLQNLVFEAGRARWRLNLGALERDLPEIAAFPAVPPGTVYEGPAVFVAGGRSDYIRSEHEATIRRLFPRSEITRVPDAGHWVHAERPNAFLRIITPFLAGSAC